MRRLFANFEVELPGQCLAAWPEGEGISVNCTIGAFEVTVNLISDSSIKEKEPGEGYWTYFLHRALVSVAKEETEDPPPVIPDENGRRDYTVQAEYFRDRVEEYGLIGQEALNRLIRFFKYKLKTPFLQEFPPGHYSFKNATWTDSSGKTVGKATIALVLIGTPGLRGRLGVQKLRPESAMSIQAALDEPIEPALYEEILSDAQTTLFERNLRRAVIELAIACEIVVKRSFFSEDSPAGAAFDYLEDKSLVRVKVLELIDRVARAAFGQSFRTDHPSHYNNVDFLFRCRNKVAHRGDLSLRDDAGVKKSVNYEMVENWWDSVQQLIEWLSRVAG